MASLDDNVRIITAKAQLSDTTSRWDRERARHLVRDAPPGAGAGRTDISLIVGHVFTHFDFRSVFIFARLSTVSILLFSI